MVQSQPRQEVIKTPISINKPGMVAHIHNPSYLRGRGRRIVDHAGPMQTHRTCIEKITKAKMAGVLAQVTNHLSNKPEAPSSNPSTAKKREISLWAW
jgi:hypothetical protein